MSSDAAYFSNAVADAADTEGRIARAPEYHCGFRRQIIDREVGAAYFGEVADEQLMEHLQSGSREALSHLFRRYADPIRSVALRILRDESEAEDIVQEVFLAVFRKAHLYTPVSGRTASWILHIAYSRAIDRRRRLHARRSQATEVLIEDRHAVPSGTRDVSFDHVLARQVVEQFDNTLSPEQQETIRLVFFEGYALSEVAESTGRSLVNVRSHYYRGLERLRKWAFREKTPSK